MEEIINFQGNCIYKTNVSYSLSQEEKNYISNLDYNKQSDNCFLSQNTYVLNDSRCINLLNLFNSYVDHYVKNILEINHSLKILNSWATINKQGGYHTPHKHPNVFLSVCFYPQVKGGGIRFNTLEDIISKKMNLSIDVLNLNEFNSRELYLEPITNDIVIFPGWVWHSGTTNNSDVDRVMIGANYFIQGSMGSDFEVNKIDF